jgi:hypothetical protein
MSTRWNSACALLALGSLVILGSAGLSWMNPVLATPGGPNGASRHIPAYYDGELFTINVFEVPGEAALLVHNKSINEIYVTNDLDEEQDFDPVIDAIQGDGFNPLWRQVLIVFQPGFTAHQFFSDDEVREAAEAGEITLVDTDEVYVCAVIGRKK